MTEDRVHRFNPVHSARLACLALLGGLGLLALISAPTLPVQGAEEKAKTAKANDFDAVIRPFLTQNCAKCHGAVKPKGKLNLLAIDSAISQSKDVDKWKAVLEALTTEQMPPRDAKVRPTKQEVARIKKALEAELAKIGESSDELARKLSQPAYGNHVSHEALFSGEHKGPAYSPARVWRTGPQVYARMLPKLAGAAEDRKTPKINKIPQAFSTSSGEGFKDYAALFVVDEPTVGQLMTNAKAIVNAQTSRDSGRLIKEFMPLVDSQKKPSQAEVNAALRKQFHLVLMREPTTNELARFNKLMERNVKDCGQVIGAKSTLATVLLLPEALYRMELGRGKVDQYGRQMLAPRELAYAIAFALTDDPPDATLLNAASSGKLASAADVRREVTRMLNDKRHKKPRILRFFDEYFEYPEANEVFKDLEKYVWNPAIIVNDTRQLVQYVLDRDQNVLKELLTTNKSFVNYKVNSSGTPEPARTKLRGKAKPNLPYIQSLYNELYSLPSDWEWSGKQPITLPGDQRAGILTQPSWLAAFATNNENHAIRRGRWVRERLFGGVVPDVPITVDAKLPDAPHDTLRKRMEVTKAEYCWTCHQKMNPIGLSFEHYDFIGRYRKVELVVNPKGPAPKPVDTTKPPKVKKPPRKGKKGEQTAKEADAPRVPAGFMAAPLDATGVVAESGDAKVDGDIKDIVALMKKAGDSPHVRQVFVRNAFRYWMGRNETLDDSPTLIAADQAYVKSGGSMKALITSLLTSDSFLYRKAVK